MAAEQAQLFSPASLGEAGDGNNALLVVLDNMSYELGRHWELYHSKLLRFDGIRKNSHGRSGITEELVPTRFAKGRTSTY